MAQSFLPGEGRCPVQRRSQQSDLDEVVEVPRLERRVLPVIREAEELARVLRERLVGAQTPDRRQPEDRRCARASARSERCELPEVTRLPAAVGDAAAQDRSGTAPG